MHSKAPLPLRLAAIGGLVFLLAPIALRKALAEAVLHARIIS